MVEHIIQRVRTVGFKGFDIDEEVPQKVIYFGRNKSGKSSRAGAIAIALYGHIPFSTAGKLPSDILNSFGQDELVVFVTIGGTEFGRKFSRNKKGGVSQSFQVDKKRMAADNFKILLDRAGAPRIANTAEFMKQSDAKKTNTLFDLYPNKDLADIDTEIEIAKEDVSRLTKKKDGAESVVVRLSSSKQAIDIPAGSIAEINAEIKSVESQIADLESQIRQAEIEEAEIKIEAKLKDEAGVARHEILKGIGVNLDIPTCRDMDESTWVEFFDGKNSEYQAEQNKIWVKEQKKKRKSETVEKKDPINVLIPKGEQQITNNGQNTNQDMAGGVSRGEALAMIKGMSPGESHEEQFGPILSNLSSSDFFHASQGSQAPKIMYNPADSIQLIIDALKGAGCGACVALIVAKKELKKYKEVS